MRRYQELTVNTTVQCRGHVGSICHAERIRNTEE